MKKALAAALAACLLLCAGCTPKTVETPPPAPTITILDDPAVKTDWSKLTPYEAEAPIYTRRYAEFTDTLIPADDYGPLIPFLGDKLGGLGGEGVRYGFVTLEGEVVIDAVFTTVWQGGYAIDGWDKPPMPYFMVSRDGASSAMDEWAEATRWAMIAQNGSWATEFKYDIDGETLNWGGGTADGLFVKDGSALVYLDGATGEERLRIEDIPQEDAWQTLFSAFLRDGKAYYADGDGYSVIHPVTGERTQITAEEGQALRWERATDDIDSESFYWCELHFFRGENGFVVERADGTVLAEALANTYDLCGYDRATGKKYVCLPNGKSLDFYDENGDCFATLPMVWDPTPVGDLFYVVTATCSGLRDADGNWIFRYPLPVGEWD